MFGKGEHPNCAPTLSTYCADSERGFSSKENKTNQSTILYRKNMSKQTQAISNDLVTLAEDVRALMSATADVAGERVAEARQRLAEALGSGKEIFDRVKEKTVERARATDQVVRENPYETIGIAFGVGALLGYLVARRCSDSRIDSSAARTE
jgi:ElaB/YqjD/DUF883 family membrane-anchored ribosome-binding protein